MDSTPNPRKRLSDILDGTADALRAQWAHTEAAGEFAPLPSGEYVAHIHADEVRKTRNGKPEYTLVFKVIDGAHLGRQLWHPIYLTPAALPMAKRDLRKLGITELEQIETGVLPSDRIRCRLRVALRTDDNGKQFNRIQRFDVIGIDEPPPDDPFAPIGAKPHAPDSNDGSHAVATAHVAEGEYADPPAGVGDATFDPATLETEGGSYDPDARN